MQKVQTKDEVLAELMAEHVALKKEITTIPQGATAADSFGKRQAAVIFV